MSVLGITALISGTLGVWLTIRQNIWCWPAALVSVLASLAEFYYQRLYGDMCLQIFYFFAGIYGWVYWYKKSGEPFKARQMDFRTVPVLLLATVLQSILYYYLLLYFKGDRPILDAALTACSLTATYMMTRKWTENWIAWFLIDGAYVGLYCLKSMWLFGLLYLLFTVMSLYGWFQWRRKV